MKLRNTFFLARANIKGNRHNNLSTAVVVLLCVSLTVISLLSFTLSNAMNEYKNDFRARTIEAYPYNKVFDEKTLAEISNISHVESIDIEDEMRCQYFNIENISDKNGTYEEIQKLIDEKGAMIDVWSLIGGEKRTVIAGKSLDEAPEFSCIIPHMFYPFDEDVYATGGLDYIDGESLIGKNLKLKVLDEGFYVDYFDGEEGRRLSVPPFEVNLKIAGVYYASPTADGNPMMIYISEDTGKKLIEMAAQSAKQSKDIIYDFISRPEYHNLHITVDSFNNVDDVYNELNRINISVVEGTELGINPSTPVISAFFNVLSILITSSTLIVSFVLILLSSKNVIGGKKEEIGMMKAIGYKNRQIFGCVTLEQIIITLRGFFIGVIISVTIVATVNIINYNSGYANRMYIMNWTDYLIFTAVTLAVVIIVPIVCESIFLRKLTKIQPREAMS